MNALEHLQDYKWTLPESYYGETWEGWYVLATQTRDSDCLIRSNFECFQKAMQPWSEHIKVIREGHWACGWIEWLGLAPEAPIEAQEQAAELLLALADYPVLNDEHFSELEQEEADWKWANCYDEKERIEWLREHWDGYELSGHIKGNFKALLEVVRGSYFPGYAGEFIY